MDADDLAHPRRLELTRALLEADPRTACASSLVESFGAVGLGRRQYDAWLNAHLSHEAMARVRFVESPVAHPAVLLRASAVEAVGGYRDDPGPEDWDLWLRLFHAGHRFEKVPRVLLRWRESTGRLSRTGERYGRDGLVRVRARHLARGPLAGRAAVLCGAGRGGKALAHALEAEGATLTAFPMSPLAGSGERRRASPCTRSRSSPGSAAMRSSSASPEGAERAPPCGPLFAGKG